MLETAQTYFTELVDAAYAVGLQRLDAPIEMEDDARKPDHQDGEWSLEVYMEDAPDLDILAEQLAVFDERLARLAPPELHPIPDKDWVAHSLEGLGIVEAGRFVLYGIHDADKVEASDERIAIRIDANQAFGTGHHPTTEGCLKLLDRFAGFAPRSIFDLGCGSAVLAIAAAKLWGRNILASDIDATSVDIARENITLNNCASMIEAVVANGFEHEAIAGRAPFDFVFANILAGPLVEFAPAMAGHVAKNGRVMLAGLMSEQEARVTSAYEAAGFRLINRLDQETWPVLLFVRT